ncbi:MAG: hypothetical protein HKN93_04690 [Acidimicrobiia bacterium]|nr:hypothetical protein [Acidimicrobiia bacterium]
MTATDAIPGCLIVNDMAAGADPEAAQRYRSVMEDGLRRALERSGDPDSAQRNQRAALLAVSVIGANLVSKTTGGDAHEVGRNVDAIIAEVLRWRAETDEDS